jgi:hypothetical protein
VNDGKYIRIYPERAVAPARKVLEQLALSSNEAAMALSQLDTLGFPKGEPIFVLRGQDVLAPPIVRNYAEDAAAEGAFGIGLGEPEGQAAFDHLMAFADAMAAWTPRKLPD